MGLSGSTHVKVGNECYDTEKAYINSYAFSNVGILPLILIVGVINIFLKFKNKIALGLLILIVLYTIYANTMGPYFEKRSFVKQYGKKVECPKPDPKCDDKYIQYLIDKKTKSSYPMYMCDGRIKYT